MRRFQLLVIVGLLLPLISAGCGYTTSSLIAQNASTVHVSNFVNKVKVSEEVTDKRMYVGYRSGMELDITREIIDKFLRDGNLRIESRDEADLILDGELVDFRKEAIRYDSADNVIEFRVKVIVNFVLHRGDPESPIVEEKYFSGESTYKTRGQLLKTEGDAITDATKDLADRVIERVVEGW